VKLLDLAQRHALAAALGGSRAVAENARNCVERLLGSSDQRIALRAAQILLQLPPRPAGGQAVAIWPLERDR
jgi:hypothetical protein